MLSKPLKKLQPDIKGIYWVPKIRLVWNVTSSRFINGYRRFTVTTILQSVGNYLPFDTMIIPTWLGPSASPLWVPQFSFQIFAVISLTLLFGYSCKFWDSCSVPCDYKVKIPCRARLSLWHFLLYGGLFAFHLGLFCRLFQTLNVIGFWMFKNFWTRTEVVTWWKEKRPVMQAAVETWQQCFHCLELDVARSHRSEHSLGLSQSLVHPKLTFCI
jgi:hypothetical protein